MFTIMKTRGYSALFALVVHALTAMAAEATVVANFTFSPANPVAGQQVQFTDTSTGSPTSWQWDFENPPNGTDSTQRNPTWIFTASGTYPVKLTALIPPLDINEVIIHVTVGSATAPGNLSFTMSSYQVNEDAGTSLIEVCRTGGSDGIVSVRCNTSGGTATAGVDYTATTDILTWANGDTAKKTCTIPILDDSLEELNETINLSLSNFIGGATAGLPSTATLTSLDVEPDTEPGQLQFPVSSGQVNEDASIFAVPVQRIGGSDGAVSVRCNTVDGGTATPSVDYITIAQTLTWAHGDTATKTCTLPILDDSLEEPDETIKLSLSNFTGGATPGSPSTATLTILDVEPGQLQFPVPSGQVSEDAGTFTAPVHRVGGSDGAVSAQCNTVDGGTATAGLDYTATAQTLTWAHGDTAAKTCVLSILDDSLEEPDETIKLSLSNFTGGAAAGSPSTATLTILDLEPGELKFPAAVAQVAEDIGTFVAPVQRVGGSDGAVSVRCETVDDGTAMPGSDYTATVEILHWADGDATTRGCMVPIVDDSLVESEETVLFALTNPTGGATLGSPSTGTLTILDNELFADGFESGDACLWSQESPGQRVCEEFSQGRGPMLRVLHGVALGCGAVQLAPVLERSGAIRLRVPVGDVIHLRLRQGEGTVFRSDVMVDAGTVLEISNLRLATYAVEMTAAEHSMRFSVELSATIPCARLEPDP